MPPFIWPLSDDSKPELTCYGDVFAFLDIEHPAVAWGVQRGMLVSADYAANPPEVGFVSMMVAGAIQHGNTKRLHNELVIEAIRQTKRPTEVSRLRGMYFFRTRAEALARAGDPKWPPYFMEENLAPMRLWSKALPTLVDANWITHAPLNEADELESAQLGWIERYWNGEAHGKSPVWEIISRGVAVVLDEDLRRRCYSATKRTFPESEPMILMARLAGEAGTRGGMVHPFLSRIDQDSVRLDYLWSDSELHDPLVIQEIGKHPDSGYLGRIMFENESWKMPDFRPWGRTISLAPDERLERFSILPKS